MKIKVNALWVDVQNDEERVEHCQFGLGYWESRAGVIDYIVIDKLEIKEFLNIGNLKLL